MRRAILVTVLTAVFAFVSVHAGTAAVESAWQDGSVTIDGSAEDWYDSLTYLEGPEMHLGARNDDQFLYLCITSRDGRAARHATMRGLVLRLDAKKAASTRIQFPIGQAGDGFHPGRGGNAEQSLDSFLLLENKEHLQRRFPVDNELGFEMAMGVEEGSFVYEIKLPLTATESRPYAIDWASGAIDVRLDTPEPDVDAMRRGGMPPGGGGRPGGRGGGMRGGPNPERDRPEPIHVKAKVRLAEG